MAALNLGIQATSVLKKQPYEEDQIKENLQDAMENGSVNRDSMQTVCVVR